MDRHDAIGLELAGLAGRLDALATIIDINGRGNLSANTAAIPREVSEAIIKLALELRLEHIRVTPLEAAPELATKG